MKNHKKINKKRLLRVALLLLAFIILVCLIIFIFKLLTKKKDLPIVYSTDGNIFVYSSKESEELGRADLASIVYSHSLDSKILYQLENELFIYQAGKKPVKLVSSANNYFFTDDDKFVILTDLQKCLYIYDGKETNKIDDNIDSLVGYTNDFLIYGKGKKLYKVSLDNRKKDTIADFYNTASLSESKKIITYLNKEDELVKYSLDSKKEKKLLGNIERYFCDEDCDKFYFLNYDNRSLYYYDGKKENKIADKVVNVFNALTDHRLIVYSKIENDKNVYYVNYNQKDLSLEDEMVKEVKVEDGKGAYLLTFKGKLLYLDFSSSKINEIAKDVFDTLKECDGQFIYTGFEDKSNKLFLLEKGEKKELDSDVLSSSIQVDEKGEVIYYLKYAKDTQDLYKMKNFKDAEKVEGNIYSFSYLKSKQLYYIKDFDKGKQKGDLYILNKKPRVIAKGVSQIISPLLFG